MVIIGRIGLLSEGRNLLYCRFNAASKGVNMKKILVVVFLIMLLASTGAFAKGTGWAIGGEGSLYFAGNGGLPTSAMFLFHIPKIPLMFGIGVSNPFSIGFTADYWFAHGNLVSFLDWYAGVGAYLSVYTNPTNFILGGRIPLGLQIWPLGQTLEIFVEVAPAVGVAFVPTAFEWHFQGAVGLRFWF